MTITTAITTQPLFLIKSIHHRNPNPNPNPTTVTFSRPIPRTIRPIRLTTTHRLHKPQATLLPLPLPLPLPSFISPSSALPILTAFLKEVCSKLILSLHEFKQPLLAVANAMGKWVELYHSVLIVRILLSWFPNMPWEKQPFSAIRDLCDPCLNFFRSIMPPSPANRTIDLSPLLAFIVLGVVGNFLKTNIPPPV